MQIFHLKNLNIRCIEIKLELDYTQEQEGRTSTLDVLKWLTRIRWYKKLD